MSAPRSPGHRAQRQRVRRALELALASRRIAVESAQLGLPEVTLGLLPGGGGTQLLNRFVDPATAAELLTSGRRLSASEARDLGLLHEVVADEALLEAALRAARAEVGQPAPEPAYGEALRNSREGLSRAAAGILDVLEVGARDGVEAGLRAEREVFLQLLASPEARAAIHLFLVRSDVNRRSRGDGTTIAQVAVVGGGQMGSGIAATAVTRGLRAVVRDVDDAALARSRGYLEKVLARRGGVSEDAMARWQGTTEWDGFAESDVVIEAVFELPDLKTDVLRKVSELVSEDTLLATNTSAIPIRKLATAVSHPERFLGMHFFSPVERMPLVELIAHQETAPRTLQRAAAVGRQLGKVPVVVGDAPGFFTSRVYARWLMEGIRLLLDGAALADIDAGANAVGFPVGPLQAHDEATLQLVLDASVTQVAEPVFRDRLDVGAVRQVLETLVANGVQGRRHGVGFYRYDENGKRVGPNEEVTALISSTTGAAIDRETIGERLLLAFATECFLCWDEGILCHPDDGDITSVLGIGFPRVLGGPFHWADETAEVRACCERLGAPSAGHHPPRRGGVLRAAAPQRPLRGASGLIEYRRHRFSGGTGDLRCPHGRCGRQAALRRRRISPHRSRTSFSSTTLSPSTRASAVAGSSPWRPRASSLTPGSPPVYSPRNVTAAATRSPAENRSSMTTSWLTSGSGVSTPYSRKRTPGRATACCQSVVARSNQARTACSARALAGVSRVVDHGSGCAGSRGAMCEDSDCSSRPRKSCSTRQFKSRCPSHRYREMPDQTATWSGSAAAAPCSLKCMASRSPEVIMSWTVSIRVG